MLMLVMSGQVTPDMFVNQSSLRATAGLSFYCSVRCAISKNQ